MGDCRRPHGVARAIGGRWSRSISTDARIDHACGGRDIRSRHRGWSTDPLGVPWTAALNLSESAPEGVELFPLVVQPKQEGVWGIKSIRHYETQGKEQGYWTRAEGDLEGPSPLRRRRPRADAKVVVVSSTSFAEDSVAFAPEVVMGSQGIQLRSRNPGNAKLMINSLHWLNGNTQL